MFARWRERRVADRRDGDFQKWLLGVAAVLRVIGSALQVFDRRADVDNAAERR